MVTQVIIMSVFTSLLDIQYFFTLRRPVMRHVQLARIFFFTSAGNQPCHTIPFLFFIWTEEEYGVNTETSKY